MKIVVLAGGLSTERDVSFCSGSMVYKALKENGHQVVLIDVYLGYEGDYSKIFEDSRDWAKEIGTIGEEKPDLEAVKKMRKDGGRSFFGPGVLEICSLAEVTFLALHGENGENGKVQAALDLMGIRYTGTDYLSSAICMDKGLTKELFQLHGVPTPIGIQLKKGEQETQEISFPCVVKACCGGSSVGVAMAANIEEYQAAKEEAFRYDDHVVIEQYIKGREFSVGVLGGKALPVIEIQPKEGFYDYKNKYQAGSAIETCPAQLSPQKTLEMQQYAQKAFRVLRLKNYARMDFMMDEKEQIFCLEANTLPGMTPTSLLPQEAAAAGISFGQLCEKIIEAALV